MKLNSCLFILSLSLSVNCILATKKTAQQLIHQDNDEIRNQIDEFVEELLDCFDVHGASLTVVKDGEVNLLKYVQYF